ncbi:MAG TPA: serine/threonine-protein kinase [Actinopolymorphaceae bacterium]
MGQQRGRAGTLSGGGTPAAAGRRPAPGPGLRRRGDRRRGGAALLRDGVRPRRDARRPARQAESRQALEYGVAAAEAVQVLHDAGIVHRDVKPGNLLIDDRTTPPRLLVSDLGSAKVLAEASGVTVTTGTPIYMAPEQVHQTEGFDGRADVYAVAAVTYHLLGGEPAFEDRTPAAVLNRRTDSRPTPIATRLGLPPELDRLLARSLSWDPAKRPATAAEFARELARFLTDDPPRAPREVPTVPTLIFCVVLAVVLFVATFSWLTP